MTPTDAVLTSNGQPADTQNGNGGPPMGEIGGQWSQDLLFYRESGKQLFLTPEPTAQAIMDMLALDGQARALEQVLTLPLRFASWRFTPAKGDSGEADYVNDVFLRSPTEGGMSTPMDHVIAQMCSAVLYRRAYFEKVFKIDGDQVRYDKIAFRPATTCWLGLDSQTLERSGFQQRYRKGDDFVQVFIPQEKACVFINGQQRDPVQGVSELDTTLSLFQSKQKIRFLWYSFLEGQTIPKMIATHANADEKEIQAFANKAATLKGGGVLGVGPGQTATPYQSNGQGASSFQAAMEYLDHEMTLSVNAGFLSLTGRSTSSGSKGSFALSRDASNMFYQGRQAVLTEMAATIETELVAPIVRYQFGPDGKVPSFTFGKVTSQAIEEQFLLLEQLMGADKTGSVLPQTFIDDLVISTAAALELDTDKITAAINARQQQAPPTPTGQLQAGIAAATELVQRAGLGPPPLSPAPVG